MQEQLLIWITVTSHICSPTPSDSSNTFESCNFSLQNSFFYVSNYLLVSTSLPIREVRFTHLHLMDHHEPFKTWHYTCPLLFLRYSGLVACNFISEFTQDPACAPSGPGKTLLFIGLIHSTTSPADAEVSSPEYSP